VTRLAPRRRNIGMVFQNYALFPHMNVAHNVGYGLAARGRPREEIARRVEDALRLVQLDGFAGRLPRELSGGQQQRVALARAMVVEPDVLLMDEPLGALDRQLRKEVQLEIRRLHLARPRTTLYVTHDQEEALVMSDRIAIMRAGRIVQIGTARGLYDEPADAFVARFLGESNLLPGRVVRIAGGEAALAVDGLGEPIVGRAAPGLVEGAAASALVRPEQLLVGPGPLVGRVVETVYLGELTAQRIRTASGHDLWRRTLGAAGEGRGGAVSLGWSPAAVRILPQE
jgi:ABC-type Fe3+/spermidine/putrescine transport system ATPase subunit